MCVCEREREREREMLSAFLMESSCFGDPFAKETASIFQTQEDRRCIKIHSFSGGRLYEVGVRTVRSSHLSQRTMHMLRS